MQFSELVRRLREERGWGRVQLQQESELSASVIFDIETGKRVASRIDLPPTDKAPNVLRPDSLRKLAKAIFDDSGERERFIELVGGSADIDDGIAHELISTCSSAPHSIAQEIRAAFIGQESIRPEREAANFRLPDFLATRLSVQKSLLAMLEQASSLGIPGKIRITLQSQSGFFDNVDQDLWRWNWLMQDLVSKEWEIEHLVRLGGQPSIALAQRLGGLLYREIPIPRTPSREISSQVPELADSMFDRTTHGSYRSKRFVVREYERSDREPISAPVLSPPYDLVLVEHVGGMIAFGADQPLDRIKDGRLSGGLATNDTGLFFEWTNALCQRLVQHFELLSSQCEDLFTIYPSTGDPGWENALAAGESAIGERLLVKAGFGVVTEDPNAFRGRLQHVVEWGYLTQEDANALVDAVVRGEPINGLLLSQMEVDVMFSQSIPCCTT